MGVEPVRGAPRRALEEIQVQPLAAVHHGEQGQDAQLVELGVTLEKRQQLIQGARREGGGGHGRQDGVRGHEDVLRDQGDAGWAVQKDVVVFSGEGLEQP